MNFCVKDDLGVNIYSDFAEANSCNRECWHQFTWFDAYRRIYRSRTV